jgi:alkylation response protein AidB-like acyl-CoA dehydrogenase
MHLDAAAGLARSAACVFDDDENAGAASVRPPAAAARMSASRAAVTAANTCHQLFGALGITMEGPVFHVTRRIRQLVSQPPREDSARAAVLELFAFEGEAR